MAAMNTSIFQIEITLYMDAMKVGHKKRGNWLDIQAKIFHLVL